MSDELVLDYYSDVKNGHLQNNIQKLIAKELPAFEGCRIHLRVKKIKKMRTLSQNNWLHLLLTFFANEINKQGAEITMERLKEICVNKFAPEIIEAHPKTGEVLTTRRMRTHEMSKEQVSDFLAAINAFALDTFNITLPACQDRGLE